MILPARVEGSADVFQCPRFVLIKPDWIPDSNSTHCELCNSKFSKIKRKHHCRMCGAVRCSKCCYEKIPLPQLGLQEPERVCEDCREVCGTVTRTRSSIETVLIDASKSLATLCRQEKMVKKVVELGGMQSLIMLAVTDNVNVLGHVASGLHTLSTHPSLHKHLAETGAIKAICRVLSRVGDANEQIAIDAISALMIFCRSQDLKTKALNDGGLHPVLSLCWSEKTAISLLAISTLGLIVEHTDNHAAVFDNKHDAVSRLLRLTTSKDEQIQEVTLKTLAFLSTGGSVYKHKLLQEDFSCGRCLEKAFNSCPANSQILCNAACVIANLATSEEDQMALHDLMTVMCRKLPDAEGHTELTCHLTRALANFSQFQPNTSRLLDAIPIVVNHVLKGGPAAARDQALRFLLNLLGHAPTQVSAILVKNDAEMFLKSLGETNTLIDNVTLSLAQSAPAVMKPM
ncbi:lateral signaling target protein 2-like protein [Plakobranchus ocellatus]|uniref:Lateral signaling target protein 2-like protein n=1 Tax=Plakobranchus ocellatus TaxID=259542 RepID=A0AAV4D5E0_9GAST|nr:lateral signaling target protein 2-like protein [Plakobranchus ocellatus]